MDWYILIVSIIVMLLLVLINIYVLAIYCAADEKGFGSTWFPKTLVILGLTLAEGAVLLLPLDVSVTHLTNPSISMKAVWYTVFLAIAMFASIFLPFTIFYYETDEDKSFRTRIIGATIFETIVFIIVNIGFWICFVLLREVQIPVESYVVAATCFSSSTAAFAAPAGNCVPTFANSTLTMDVSFAVFVIGFLVLVGWAMFLAFGGFGLFGIPMEYISAFRFRPQKRDPKDIVAKKKLLSVELQALIENGNNLGKDLEDSKEVKGLVATQKAKQKANAQMNKFKAEVRNFERDYEIFSLEMDYASMNPFFYFVKLVVGILLFIFAFVWWLHVLFYVVIVDSAGVPFNPFLNTLLTWFEGGNLSFLSTAITSFVCLYLLWSVQQGQIYFGSRIPFLCPMHPMKANETYMNSLIFNVTMVLICSVAVVQFCNQAFSQYTRLTTISNLLEIQISHLTVCKYLLGKAWFAKIYLGISALTLILQCILPPHRPKNIKKIEELKKESDEEKKKVEKENKKNGEGDKKTKK